MDFTAKRKKELYIVVSAIVFSVAALLLSYNLCSNGGGESPPDIGAFDAVPVDASAVIYFDHFGGFYDAITGKSRFFQEFLFIGSEFDDLFEKVTRASGGGNARRLKRSSTVVSSHYSAKERVSSLLSVFVGDSDRELASIIDNTGREDEETRDYNGVSIYRLNEVSFAFFKGFLIASPSEIVLESSLRHLASGTSLAQNREFRTAVQAGVSNKVVVVLNHKQTGKLFSGFVSRNYLGYAEFLSDMTDWSVLNITYDRELLSSKGKFVGEGGSADYISSFDGVKPAGQKIISVVPATTFALLTVSADDISLLARKMMDYRRYNGESYDADKFEVALNWADSLQIKEAGCAIVNFAGRQEAVTILRTARGQISKLLGKDDPTQINSFEQRGYPGLLFGSFFDLTEEESWLRIGSYMVVGPTDVIGEIIGEYSAAFSMEDYIRQTKARNLLPDREDLLALTLNMEENRNVTERMLNDNTRSMVHAFFSEGNILLSGFRVTAGDNGLIVPKLWICSDSSAPVPEPSDGVFYDIPGWYSDSVVAVPAGPFEVLNHDSNEKEYLLQLESKWLRLADKDMNGIWAIPFDANLRGYVEQIDFFGNGNLQMLFATDRKLFLLDRTGRYVPPFPVDIQMDIALGPKVYRYVNDKPFSIMLLHKDNSLVMYERDGKPAKEWNSVTMPEKIKEFPEMFEVDGDNFFALRTSRRLSFFRSDGSPLLDLSDEQRIRPDSGIEFTGGGRVKVKNVEGKFMLIDMKSGKFVVKRN